MPPTKKQQRQATQMQIGAKPYMELEWKAQLSPPPSEETLNKLKLHFESLGAQNILFTTLHQSKSGSKWFIVWEKTQAGEAEMWKVSENESFSFYKYNISDCVYVPIQE